MFKLEISKVYIGNKVSHLRASVLGLDDKRIDTLFAESISGQPWKTQFPDYSTLLNIDPFKATDIVVSLQRLVDKFVFGDDEYHSCLPTSSSFVLSNEIRWTNA